MLLVAWDELATESRARGLLPRLTAQGWFSREEQCWRLHLGHRTSNPSK